MPEDYRFLFEEDYTNIVNIPHTPSEVSNRFAELVCNDPYIKMLSEDKKDKIYLFVTSCIFIAQRTKAHISADVSEKEEKITVFCSAPYFQFDTKALMPLSCVCISAMTIAIISADKGNDTTLISFDLNLSDKTITFADHIANLK